MTGLKPSIHGRDHLPYGADPIPGLGTGAGTILNVTDVLTSGGLIPVTSTNPAAPTDIVTASTLTFDGATQVQILFYASVVDVDMRPYAFSRTDEGGVIFELYRNGVAQGVFADYNATQGEYFASSLSVSAIDTPPAGPSTYAIKAYLTQGTGAAGYPTSSNVYGSGVTTPHTTRPAFIAVILGSSTTPVPLSPGAVPLALIDVLGDLIVGTGNDTVGRLGVGADGQVLTSDSTASFGIKWGAVSGVGGGPKVYLNKPAANITRTTTTVGAFSTPWQIAGVIVASGQNVRLTMSAASFGSVNNSDILFAFLRGGTQIASANFTSIAAGGTGQVRTLTWVDENPGAGTYTYEVQAAMFTSGTLTVYQTNITTDVNGGDSVFIAEVYTP